MEGWQATLVVMLVSVIMWLGGMLYNARNPQGLAATVNTQQDIINKMQKEIQELKILVKSRRIKFNAVIVADEEIYIESSSVEFITETPDIHSPTRPHGKGIRSNGFGGMKP